MANRQALRDFQTRLAERLTQAQSQGIAQGWLAVELGGKKILLPLAQSGEVVAPTSIQMIAYTQEWYLGVANLRGELLGVIDLAGFVYGTAGRRAMADINREQARLVALSSALEVNCAMLIDRLIGLRSSSDFVSRLDAPAGSKPYMSAQYIDATGQDWIELNLQEIVWSSEFLNIGVTPR